MITIIEQHRGEYDGWGAMIEVAGVDLLGQVAQTKTTNLTYQNTAVDGLDLGNHLSLLDVVELPKGTATTLDAADFVWDYGYDPAGNIATVNDPTGATTRLEWNQAGSTAPGTLAQLWRPNATALEPDGAPYTFAYTHPSGQPTSFTDPLGNTTAEGGPPTTYDRYTAHAADDHWSRGVLARPDGPTTPAVTGHTADAVLAEAYSLQNP